MLSDGDLECGLSARQHRRRLFAWTVLLLGGTLLPEARTQSSGPPIEATSGRNTTLSQATSQTDLQRGVDLTRRGLFKEAIPSLLKVRSEVPEDYAAGFNLALCYLGVGEFKQAISMLNDLRSSGHDTAAVNNLLAQSYIGDGQTILARQALEEASRETPKDESLYAFVADACTDHYAYGLGLQVVDLGLQHLPGSARLHYERAVFLARLDRLEEAKPEFQLANKLAPGSDIAYLALIQESLYEDNLSRSLSLAREGIRAGHRDYEMLSLLGTVLLHAGAAPGQPEFLEARTALEASVAAQPSYSTSQIALGKLYLMEGRSRDAVTHLEIGRRLEPQNPSIYTSLADAYRRLGDRDKAKESLSVLSKLLREKSASTNPPVP
jgi:predicted Zn-dependent protease